MENEDEEMLKAQAQYEKQRTQFRAALNSGLPTIARYVATNANWGTDQVNSELIEWFEENGND